MRIEKASPALARKIKAQKAVVVPSAEGRMAPGTAQAAISAMLAAARAAKSAGPAPGDRRPS